MSLLLSVSTLFSATLVVDNTPTSGWFFGSYSCEARFFPDNPYTTIQTAVNNASNNDTIKICKGDYEEIVTIDGKNDLIIEPGQDVSAPSDVNWYSNSDTLTVKGNTKNLTIQGISINSNANSSNYKNINIQKAKDKITLQDLNIDTSNGASAIYVDNNVNNNLEGKYKNLTITSKGQGIYIEKGDKQEFDTLNIIITNTNANYYGIYLGNNVQNKKHSFKNLTFSLKQDSAIKLNRGEDMKFEDITITATNFTNNTEAISLQNNLSNNAKLEFKNINITLNKGIGINIKKANDTKFENITIKNSSQWAIWLRDNVNGKPEFKDVNIEASIEGGIKIQKGKDVKFDRVTISGISGNGFIIWLTNNVTGNQDFKNITASTHAQGILVDKANKIDFDTISIQGDGSSSNYYGIKTSQNVTGDIKIKNCDINVSGKALYMEKGKPQIRDSRFESQLEEKVLHFLSNTDKVEVEKSCIYKDASGGNAYGLYIQNNKTNAKIKENCFFGSPLQNLAFANQSGNEVDKNYWEGLTANSYNYNHILDNNPQSSCNLSCSSNTLITSPIISYQMDECSWDTDSATFEIKNYGTLGNDANATAVNDANTTQAKICRGGDINSTSTEDKALLIKNNLTLPDDYTLTTWIKFPLNEVGHKIFPQGYGWNRRNVKYFNIADRPGSNNDFIYFKHDITNDDWYLCMQGDNYECKSYNPQNLSGWHLVILKVEKGDTETKFYLDNNVNTVLTFNQAPQGDLGLVFNSDYNANTTNETNGQSIGTITDEFRVYSGLLSQTDINSIYNETRECQACGGGDINATNYKFDAWDTFRNIADRNISTKIVNKEFSLTIASLNENGTALEDFNGTVCAKVDTNTSKLWFINESSKTATFTLNKAIKTIKVALSWKKNVNENCPLLLENNETNSTDNFAIRPKYFTLSTTVPLIAGSDFNLSVEALDNNGNDTSDYNETLNDSFTIDTNITKNTCALGNFSLNTFNFSNGKKEDINSSYGEVGDLNITIKEKNGSEFAKIDADDTNDTQRFIEQNSTTVTFIPHHFSIINYDFTRNNPDDTWRYMADVNDSNISISFNVQAKNEQNQTTQNFDAQCAATDVGVKIDLNTTNNDANASYFEYINNTVTTGHDKNLSDINFSGIINDNNFTAGDSTKVQYALNVYRIFDSPKEPRTLSVQEVNTTSSNVKNIGLVPDNNNSKFYYARLYTQDLSTSKTPDTIQAKVLVYDSTADAYVTGLQEELSNWYHYKPQNASANGNIIALNVSNNITKKASNDDGISATSTFDNNGTFDVNVSNPSENTQTHYIHLDVSPWIWYVHKNFGNDYNDSVGSSCSEHPCIKYNYNKKSDGNGVSSGSVSGVSFDANVSKNSRGIRLLR
ncbi:right-handed parallel beta-helix repeat-containing protein [Sulfurimonas sp.]